MTPHPDSSLPASFRDPSGFLFIHEETLYRQINQRYQNDYTHLMASGLYQTLVDKGLLIAHEEVESPTAVAPPAYKIIRPTPLPFISYPYEWCFSQLKTAALITLSIQKEALAHGMILKDASAYNIQFHNGRCLLIDTLSLAIYHEGQTWDAYRQFCQHFLAPLALIAYTDVRLSQLLRLHIDGIPLALASKLLPFRTRFNLNLLTHIHLHSAAQKRSAPTIPQTPPKMSRTALIGLIESLTAGVSKLQWRTNQTAWANYYEDTNYSEVAHQHKAEQILAFLDQIQPRNLWDLGANTGRYSRLASERGIPTVAFDVDPGAVEQAYRTSKEASDQHFLPLVMDLTNPSPSLGWHHQERDALLSRGPAHTIMALALIHHLAITNNVPLDRLAQFFQAMGHWLIIEFVPKNDSQLQRLLATRADIFPDYTPEGFEATFAPYFITHAKKPIAESERLLYLMEQRP